VKRPHARETPKITMKKKNNSFAISADPAAIPPKPKIAAMIAMMKNTSDQRNMMVPPNVGFGNGAIYDAVCPSVHTMVEPPDATGESGRDGDVKAWVLKRGSRE
jgi:hypothetical protein